MIEGLEPDVSKNKGSQLFSEPLLNDEACRPFNKRKSCIREDDDQDLIDGINIMNRETINEVSYLMNNSSGVKLYSCKAYENILKTFCDTLLQMGIDATFYDINEGQNTDNLHLNDLAIINTFKSKKDLCDRILAIAREKYAKTVSINQENTTNENADYNIHTFSLRERNDSKVVKSVLDCLSFAAFTNKIADSGSYKSNKLLN